MGCRIKLPFEERVGLLKFVEKAAAAGKSQERKALRKRFQKKVLVRVWFMLRTDVKI